MPCATCDCVSKLLKNRVSMTQKEKQDLLKLDKFNRWMVVTYWRWLLIKQNYSRQSLPLRLVPIHAVCMILLLLAFPYNYPTITTIPVIVCVAYYLTILFLFVQPAYYKSKIKRVKVDNE